MNERRGNYSSSHWPAVIILVTGLLLVALAYRPGLTGTFHFDDAHNLTGLAKIDQVGGTLDFLMSGHAGPLGRPLSLASFIPQAYAWPSAPEVFLLTNVTLHLLNGALLAWMLYLIGLRSGRTALEAGRIASVAAAIWMALPILASSSLFVVQRMTTLSAAFVFMGFIGYLYARGALERRPRLALTGMAIALVVGTTLAALAKENGALLPVLVLVAEVTLLKQSQRTAIGLRWRLWRLVFLLLPTIMVLGYLSFRLDYNEAVYLRREFSASDRLLSQAHILWQYLYHAFLPTPSALGPFHDGAPLQTNWLNPLSIMAVAAWLAVSTAAVALRRQMPLLTFAVAWYIAGHLLESTTVPLELYFEHRNYVPLAGPVFSLTAVLLQLSLPWRPFVRVGIAAYAVVLTIVLFSTTSLWGQPALAAEMWVKNNPGSVRAIQYLAQQLESSGDYATSRRVLLRYLKNDGRHAAIGLQALGLSCILQPQGDQEEQVVLLEDSLRTAKFAHDVAPSLEKLYDFASEERCAAVTTDVIVRLANATLSNPAFSANSVSSHNIHLLLARQGIVQRDLSLTMHHLEHALAAFNAPATVALAVQILRSAGLHSSADEFLQDARRRAPQHPMRKLAWHRRIDVLLAAAGDSRG